MSKISKVSFTGVWIAVVLFLPLSQMPWLFSITQEGWPDKQITEIGGNNPGYLIKLVSGTMVLSNLPDYLSILLYVKMYMLARTSVQAELPVVIPNPEAPGGIWMGEDLPHLEDNYVVQQNSQNALHNDKMKSILVFLRWNAMSCLLDLASGLVYDQLMCQGILGMIACLTFQNLVSHWIPMLVIGTDFKKFRGFLLC